MQGRVKLFLRNKGYGWVRNEGGEWFFHCSQVKGAVASGDIVEFWLDDSPHSEGKLVAVDVRKYEEQI